MAGVTGTPRATYASVGVSAPGGAGVGGNDVPGSSHGIGGPHAHNSSVQSMLGVGGHDGRRATMSGPGGAKFSEQDVDLLRQLLVAGERHKWKQITKQINRRSAERRGEDLGDDDAAVLATKNVSPTYVIKQYQSMLGVPKNLLYFGVLGLLLPYVVAEKGWDDLEVEDVFTTPERID